MAEELPIACSLDAAQLKERLERWQRLRDSALLEVTSGESTRTLHFRPAREVEDELRELVRLELECCPFFELRVISTDTELRLEAGAPAGAEAALESFARPVAARQPAPRPAR